MIQNDLFTSQQVLVINSQQKQIIKVIWIDSRMTQEKINQLQFLRNSLSEQFQGITIEAIHCKVTEFNQQNDPAIMIINTDTKKRINLKTTHQCVLQCETQDHYLQTNNQEGQFNMEELNSQVNRICEDIFFQIKLANYFNPPCVANNQYSHSNCTNLALYLTLQEFSKQNPSETEIMEQLFSCCNDYGQRILLETDLQNQNFENVFEKIMYCYQKKAIFSNLNSKFAQNDFQSISHLACVLFKGFQESQDDNNIEYLYRYVCFEKESDYLQILDSFENGWSNNQVFQWNTIIKTTQYENVANQQVLQAPFGLKFIIKLDQYNQHPQYYVQMGSQYFSEGDILLYPQFTFRCKKIEGFLNHSVIQIKQSYQSSGFTLNFRLRKRFWQEFFEDEISPAIQNIISHLGERLNYLINEQFEFLNFRNFTSILNKELLSYVDKIQTSITIFLEKVNFKKLLTNLQKINTLVKQYIVFAKLNNLQQLEKAQFLLKLLKAFYTNNLLKALKHNRFDEIEVLNELQYIINQVPRQILKQQPIQQFIQYSQPQNLSRTFDTQQVRQIQLRGTPESNIERTGQVRIQQIQCTPEISQINKASISIPTLNKNFSQPIFQEKIQIPVNKKYQFHLISNQPVQIQPSNENSQPEEKEIKVMNQQFEEELSTQSTEGSTEGKQEISETMTEYEEKCEQKNLYHSNFQMDPHQQISSSMRKNDNIMQILSQNCAQQLSHESVTTTLKKEIQSRKDKQLYQEKKVTVNANSLNQDKIPKLEPLKQKQTNVPNNKKPGQQNQISQKNLLKKQQQQTQQTANTLGAVGATAGSIMADIYCEGLNIERQGPQVAIGLIQLGLPAILKNSKILNVGYGFSLLMGAIEIGGVFFNDRLSEAEKFGKTVKLVAGTASAIGIQAYSVSTGFALMGVFGAIIGGIVGGFAGYLANRVINQEDESKNFQIFVSFRERNFSQVDSENNLSDVGKSPTIRVSNIKGKMRTLIIYAITETHLSCLIVKRLQCEKEIYIAENDFEKNEKDEFLFYLGPQQKVHREIKFFAFGIEESEIDNKTVLRQLFDKEFTIIDQAEYKRNI